MSTTFRSLYQQIPLLAGLFVLVPALDANDSAVQFLRQERKLERVAGGSIWRIALDEQLRQRHREMPKLKKSIISSQKQLDERIVANERAWQAFQQRSVPVRNAMRKISKSDPRHATLMRQLDTLRNGATQPNELGASQDVRAILVGITSQINRLVINISWLRQQTPVVVASYDTLAKDSEVQAALAKIGSGARLASTNYFVKSRRELGEYDELLKSTWIPMYLQSGTPRICGVVNEQFPITFSWRSTIQSVILPSSVARSVGIGFNDETSNATLKFEGRELTAKKVTIPYLQFGGHLLRNVSAHILAPEAEDLGAWIGPQTFQSQQTVVDRRRLRLDIRE